MSAQPGKLAEFAAPTRARPKYAPLTAGLLARKGEAVPATPYFAMEALDLNAEPRHASPEPAAVVEFSPVAHAEPKSEAGPDHADPEADERRQTAAAYRAASRFWRPRPAARPPARQDHQWAEELFDLPASDVPAAEPQAPTPAADAAVSPKPGARIALSVELDLGCVAKLAAHAHREGMTAAQVIEAALGAHLGGLHEAPTP